MYCVYIIQNIINNKTYVGKTNKPHTRWLQHKNINRCTTSKQPLHKAILKYGSDNFSFSILERCDDEKESLEMEKFWIAYLKSLGSEMYNMTDGGDGASSGPLNHQYGKPLSVEVKTKLSKSHTGKHIGSNNYMFGKTHTDKSKLKISHANKKISDETISNIRKLSETKQYTGRELSKMFGVSPAQISRIINNKQRNL